MSLTLFHDKPTHCDVGKVGSGVWRLFLNQGCPSGKLLTSSLQRSHPMLLLLRLSVGDLGHSGRFCTIVRYDTRRFKGVIPLALSFVCFFPHLVVSLVRPRVALQFHVLSRPLFTFHARTQDFVRLQVRAVCRTLTCEHCYNPSALLWANRAWSRTRRDICFRVL